MKKYRFARSLAWLVVAGGIGFFLLCLILPTLMSASPLAGGILAGQMYFLSVFGLLLALLGFVFHCIFDVSEAFIRHQMPADD